jgi:hypothetical protein
VVEVPDHRRGRDQEAPQENDGRDHIHVVCQPGNENRGDPEQQAAAAHGQGLATARESVVLQLYGMVQQAAMVKSFDDCFLIVTIGCALAILPALLLKRSTSGSAAGPIEL